MSISKMHKMWVVILGCVVISTSLEATHEAISHTFFSVPCVLSSYGPQFQSFNRMLPHTSEPTHPHDLQIVVGGGHSTHEEELARYFLPFNKSSLVVGELESNAVKQGFVDVIAHYLGIFTKNPFDPGAGFVLDDLTFQSTITFAPHQVHAYAGFEYKNTFLQCKYGNVWASIIAPVVWVKNYLGFTEYITNVGGNATPNGFVSTARQALQGEPVLNFGPKDGSDMATFPGGDKHFEYGKIFENTFRGCQGFGSICRIADVTLKLGITRAYSDTVMCDVALGFIAPTGNKPTGEYIFEPIAGNNQHAGISLETGLACHVWQSADHTKGLSVHGQVYGSYLFGNVQKRSFDLVDKQWSRYMWVYPYAQAQPMVDIEPGINYFTQDMCVHPRFSSNVSAALVYRHGSVECEIGYSAFARSAEKVSLHTPWSEEVGIAGIFGNDPFGGSATTNSKATIRMFTDAALNSFDQSFSSGGTTPLFIPIKEQDINLASAAHPAVQNHMIYAALRYVWDYEEGQGFISGGGSYESGETNGSLHRWNVWAKGGISF